MNDHLVTTIADGVGTILFNRPERRNAPSPEMTDAFVAATLAFETNRDVRCVLVRGAGKSFMAGGDLLAFHEEMSEDRAAYCATFERRIVNGHLALHRLRRMPKPVVVAVQGAASGY